MKQVTQCERRAARTANRDRRLGQKKRRPIVSRLGPGDALNGSVNGYVALKPKSEPPNVGYLNTRRLAAAPFNWEASIRFAASPIEEQEPTT
ncbi:MAG: hypothetical protein R6U98_00355 [Pirellulaceae bacterium]